MLLSLVLNKKKFEQIIQDMHIPDEEYQDIFRMCFSLGLFSQPSEEIKQFIIKILFFYHVNM